MWLGANLTCRRSTRSSAALAARRSARPRVRWRRWPSRSQPISRRRSRARHPSGASAAAALAQADAIRDRAIDLAAEVGHAYQVALATLARTLAEPTATPAAGAPDLGAALERAVEPLLQVGEAASDAAELAELVARSGTSMVRADAVAATMLATVAAEICAHLVEVNLLVTGDDERARRAREIVASAAASREAARALGR